MAVTPIINTCLRSVVYDAATKGWVQVLSGASALGRGIRCSAGSGHIP